MTVRAGTDRDFAKGHFRKRGPLQWPVLVDQSDTVETALASIHPALHQPIDGFGQHLLHRSDGNRLAFATHLFVAQGFNGIEA